ncbi:hypothetical protein HPP92_004040 [Vanilla planifolia]|nr:hypothetical protein HPP92_004040 [Vanilla planifolia]
MVSSVFVSALVVGVLVVTAFNMGLLTSHSTVNAVVFPQRSEKSISESTLLTAPAPPPPGADVPRLAYLISGSKSDLDSLWRLLLAIYHPRNIYILHLDRSSPPADKVELAARLLTTPLRHGRKRPHHHQGQHNHLQRSNNGGQPLFTPAPFFSRRAKTGIGSSTSAHQIILLTQDDLLFAFSKVPRNLNFMEHTGKLGWKEEQRAKPMIVDPGLYKTTKSDVFWALPRENCPVLFKLFTGSLYEALAYATMNC